MSEGDPEGTSRRGGLRRAMDGAFDATVGRVGHSVADAAMDVTSTTVEQVIADLEPYLVQEAIPRIVDGVTPYLSESVVPAILEDLTPRLVEDLLPRILEDMRPYLEAELVPSVVDALVPHLSEKVAPELIESLMPTIRDEIAPQLVDSLMPMIEERIAPQLVDALMPKIEQEVAPQLIESLMPTIEQQVAPQLVDALMPKIEQEVAPQLVDSLMPMIEERIAPQLVDALMPKIRKEVVPTILDDIVDDPAVRDLIREQSQGLFLDALEAFRSTLADADGLVDRFGRHVLRQPARPAAQTGLDLVLDQSSTEDGRPLRLAVADLAATRAAWRSLPVPPAPPGRSFTYAGAVTRLLALAIDVTVIGWVAGQGLTTLLSLLQSLFGTLPAPLVAAFSFVAASLIPVYLTLCYWAVGRTLGMAVTGIRVCTPDGRRPGFVRSMVRAWLGMVLLVVWVVTGVLSVLDPKRRTLLDRLLHTEVRYSVPENQQRRHIRDALQQARAAQSAPVPVNGAGPGGGAGG